MEKSNKGVAEVKWCESKDWDYWKGDAAEDTQMSGCMKTLQIKERPGKSWIGIWTFYADI